MIFEQNKCAANFAVCRLFGRSVPKVKKKKYKEKNTRLSTHRKENTGVYKVYGTTVEKLATSAFFTRMVMILFVSCSLNMTAQTSTRPDESSLANKIGVVSGRVLDKGYQQPLAYATVIIKSKATGKTLTGGITTDDGRFKIKEVPEGTLILEVQFIGYETVTMDITVSRKNRNIDLGVIYVTQEAQELEGVEVSAERSTIEQKIDRKVINVGKDLTTTGASASDIMVNIPSVDIDQDGNLSLRGNTNVRVLVDGKPTNIETSQLLQQIPSTSIQKIELITNPSAKYNPEGMSGIVNIVLKKNTNVGFNGNFNIGLNVGREARFNSSLGMNYRREKINVYGNYSNNIGKNPIGGTIYRPTENSDQLWDNLNNQKTHLYKIGLDYYIDDKNTISVYTNQNFLEADVTGLTAIEYLNGDIPDLSQNLISDKSNNAATYNFDFKHDFNKEGHNIELEIDYNDFESSELSDFGFTGGGGSFSSYTDHLDDDRKNTLINLDYVNPLSQKSKLELGAEVWLRTLDNIYKTTNANLRDSDFSYDRSIYSIYATFGQNFKKWSYQLGARLENYEVDALFNQTGVDAGPFTDEIFSVYPSAFVKYIPNPETQKNAYQISFSRRVDRPGVGQVNPIRVWATPRITSIGNPNLDPQFTNSIEMNYTRRLDKGSVTAGVFFRSIEDEINRIGFHDPEDPTKIILSYDNYNNNTAYGFEVSGNYKPTSWWSFNASFDLYSQTQKGVVEEEYLEVDNVLYNFRINNSIKATKNITLQVFGMYRGPNENLQFKVEEFYFINAGGRYSFSQGRGTASITFNDIFHTQQWSFDGERPLKQIGEFSWDSQTVYLGLSYRFGGGKNRALSRKRRDKNEKSGSGGIL